jgi:hypothetical protein
VHPTFQLGRISIPAAAVGCGAVSLRKNRSIREMLRNAIANFKGGTQVKRVVNLLCLIALCLLMGFGTMAQTVTGSLIGTVVDADGKAIVGATITIVDSNTNQAMPAVKSGENGRFAVNELPPGHYKVTVTMANFKTAVNNDVEIITTRTYELPVRMQVGEAKIEMTIEAGQQLLETVNTSTQATVSGRSITNLPLVSRSALLLAVLDPGAQTVGGPRNSTFEGLPKGTINVTFDGINAQDSLLKSSDGFFAINDPRIDDIEEFGITTTGNDPSKTGQGAVQMAYVSKKGGNSFHGGVWEYNRNTAFDSNYYFNNRQGLPRQNLQLNDFGYKIGGPILKDKLFFFTDFDFFQFPQSVARSRNILNSSAAGGVFQYAASAGGTPTANTTCTSLDGAGKTTANSVCSANLFAIAGGLIDPNTGVAYPHAVNGVILPFLTAIESSATAPGVTVSSTPPSPFQQSIQYNSATMGTRRYPDVRLDWNITKRHSFEFDYHYAHYASAPDLLNNQDAIFPVAPFNTSTGKQLSNRNLFVGAERWVIGSNKSNEIRFGIQSSPVVFGFGETPALFPQIASNLSGGPQPFTFAITGISGPFLNFGNSQGRNTPVGELHDTFGWTHGAHQFAFGFDASLINLNDFFNFNATVAMGINSNDPALNSIFAASNFPGISSTQLGNAEGVYASLTGRVTSYNSSVFFSPTARNYVPGQNRVDNISQFEMGIFGGDSWRVRPNLTFNYGLRWEYEGAPYDKFNEYWMVQNTSDVFGISGPGNLFKPGSSAGVATQNFVNDKGRSWYNSYLRAFAPSVGLAYQPGWDNGMLRHIFGAPGKTVLRAGYSISYSREGIGSFTNQAQSNPGYTGAQVSNAAAATNVANGQFQAGTVLLGQPGGIMTAAQSPSAFSSIFAQNPALGQASNAFDPNLRPPMVESWNAGIQRELTPNLVLELRYQANHGVGLTDSFNLNEVNIFENGFLNEFNNANSNLSICNTNAAACVAAQKDVGLLSQASTATVPLADFADLFGAATTACAQVGAPASCATSIAALSGQHTLPIMTAAFNTGLTPATLAAATTSNSATAGQLNTLFRNSTLLTELGVNGAGSFANSIGTGSSNFTQFITNLVSAGFPSNFFVVNPTATGGSFITANGAQSTFNALIVDLRHRPYHGLQFDVSYTFSKSLTNYQANSSGNNFNYTTLRNQGFDKGPAPFNNSHSIKLQLVYALPFGSGHRLSSSKSFVNRLIGGWEIDSITRFQTGQPILITSGVAGGNTFNNNDPGINLVGLTRQQIQSTLTTNKSQYAGAVGYVPVALLSSSSPTATANLSIFQPCNVAGTRCGKPFFTGPSFFRADISLVKTTKITERINFEMRMEALNALNDADFYWGCGAGTSPCSFSTQFTRFGQMGGNSTNGAYSDINTTQDPGGRIVQLVGRINF